MGFLSNNDGEKAEGVTKEVSKKQILEDDDDDDMEEMFIMVRGEMYTVTRNSQISHPLQYSLSDVFRLSRVTRVPHRVR